MDERELPAEIGDLRITGASPTTPSIPSISALYEPNARAHVGETGSIERTESSPTTDLTNLDYNGAKGPGGVCVGSAAEPATAPASHPDAVSPFPAPLIPDQPLPPGAPAGLAEAMIPVMPPSVRVATDLSTPSTDLSTGVPHEPSAGAHAEQPLHTSPDTGFIDGNGRNADDRKKHGRPHPNKPCTPAQIAEFAQLWYDAAYTKEQIARRYKTVERTLTRWRIEFGLPERDNALKHAGHADSITGAASAMINGLTQATTTLNAMTAGSWAPAGSTVTGQVVPAKFDPLQDKEIAGLLADVQTEARMITAHSDLQTIQRKLMKLAVLSATKVPVRTWEGLAIVVEALQRSILNARRIEADIPNGGADPVLLRKEAAGQMMRELKSVLTPAEQVSLANLVKAGADRLMARGGDSATITAGVEG